MYSRIFSPPKNKSFFLFGARGTGKSTWLKSYYPQSNYVDLLEEEIYLKLISNPQKLGDFITGKNHSPVIIDEIQRIPELLNEVHRLIEKEKRQFVLTGSSARKLKKSQANLLGGRALKFEMFPLTVCEVGNDFELDSALKYGMLPARFSEELPAKYLSAYFALYIREEVQQERLTRNISAFHRFLEAASFSQAQPLVISNVAQDCHVERKVVEEYFNILDDLLLAFRLPAFTKKAKRELLLKEKFFFFDCGVYHTIRPKGPLDSSSDINGPALETLIVQELRALNSLKDLGHTLYHWRTKSKHEVDLVLYGQRGLIAIEIKHAEKVRAGDLDGLNLFKNDYPMAKCFFVYCGNREYTEGNILCVPVEIFLKNALSYL